MKKILPILMLLATVICLCVTLSLVASADGEEEKPFSVEGTLYDDLQAAFNAAKGKTVVVVNDCEITVTGDSAVLFTDTAYTSYTLDLCGCDMTINGTAFAFATGNCASLMVTDSAHSGAYLNVTGNLATGNPYEFKLTNVNVNTAKGIVAGGGQIYINRAGIFSGDYVLEAAGNTYLFSGDGIMAGDIALFNVKSDDVHIELEGCRVNGAIVGDSASTADISICETYCNTDLSQYGKSGSTLRPTVVPRWKEDFPYVLSINKQVTYGPGTLGVSDLFLEDDVITVYAEGAEGYVLKLVYAIMEDDQSHKSELTISDSMTFSSDDIVGEVTFYGVFVKDINPDDYRVDNITAEALSLTANPVDADTACALAYEKVAKEDYESTTVLYKANAVDETFSCISYNEDYRAWVTQLKKLTLDDVKLVLSQTDNKFAVVGTANYTAPVDDPEPKDDDPTPVIGGEEKKSPVGIIIAIIAVVLVGSYFGGFFFLYKKGKLTAVFFKKMYRPMDKMTEKLAAKKGEK